MAVGIVDIAGLNQQGPLSNGLGAVAVRETSIGVVGQSRRIAVRVRPADDIADRVIAETRGGVDRAGACDPRDEVTGGVVSEGCCDAHGIFRRDHVTVGVVSERTRRVEMRRGTAVGHDRQKIARR